MTAIKNETELKKLTKQKLIEYANEHNIEIDDTATKQIIIKLILDCQQKSQELKPLLDEKFSNAKASEIEPGKELNWVLNEIGPLISGHHGFRISARKTDNSFEVDITGRYITKTFTVTD